jgi:hypothetical protein
MWMLHDITTKLFMWMLRDITTKFWVEGIVYVNVKWYHNKYIWVGEIVYVNVTWYHTQIYMSWRICLCKCYITAKQSVELVKLFM